MKESIKKLKSELGSVLLVAVSKTKSNEEILKAYDLGIRDFGENYVQELITKMDSLPKDINWHMIGHLQTNKVKDLLKHNIYLIHSVDSIKLAKEINKRSSNKQDILLEINIANEESKYGFIPDEKLLKETLKEIQELEHINCIGLMCVAPNTSNPEENTKYFNKLKDLGNNLNLKVLSMGMSNDYIYACKCGSTYIRVGTKIFGERDYTK